MENHLFTQKVQKLVQIGLAILNPNFSIIRLFGWNMGKERIVDFDSLNNSLVYLNWCLEITKSIFPATSALFPVE